MLVEQAFFHLPEILHGSGYQPQEYESGIVGAFSLALLQALNGRNASNPIGCMQHEKRYREEGIYPYVPTPRHLRADLYLDTFRLHTATRRLAQYGWRHHNWIEAKFLRGQTGNADRHSPNKTNHVAAHLADLVRLATLVPEDGSLSISGRYFLHVYDAPPEYYLTYSRPWCRPLVTPGSQNLTFQALEQEVGSVLNLLGSLPELSLAIRITNFVIEPSDTSHLPCYWCVLTRFDGLAILHGEYTAIVFPDRSIWLSSIDSLDRIAAFVATTIQVPPPESAPPPEVDSEQPNDEEMGGNSGNQAEPVAENMSTN
jgi:hypothetical protein